MKMLKRALAAVAFTLAAQTFITCAVAEDFPARPVTMIVPYAAGGAGDILARVLGARLEPKWGGKPLVIENKTGAGGIIGAKFTASADPDGYTLMIAPSATMAVNVSLFKSLPYDPAEDFVPLALAAQTPFVLVVNPDIPVKPSQSSSNGPRNKAANFLTRRPVRACRTICSLNYSRA